MLIISFDPDLYEIIWLSLKVSFSALFISCIIGLPISGLLSSTNFYGKRTLIIFFNSMMALPPVFVGLILYLLFSNTGEKIKIKFIIHTICNDNCPSYYYITCNYISKH